MTKNRNSKLNTNLFSTITIRKQSFFANIAVLLVVGMLFTALPSVSDAHSLKETYTTTTSVVTNGWMWRTNSEGVSEYVYAEISRTTTTTTAESAVSHSHPWDKIITAVAAVGTAAAAVYTAVTKKP